MIARTEVMCLMDILSAIKLPMMCFSSLQRHLRKQVPKLQKVKKAKRQNQLKKRLQKGRKLIQQLCFRNSKSTFILIQSSLSEVMTSN